MICLIFQKNCIDSIFSKRQKSHRLIAFIFVNTIQYPHTLKNNIYHSNKWGPPPFFCSDINPVLGHFLVYCVDKTHILVVIVELILLLFLNILSFNFVQTPSKSLKLPCCCSNQSFHCFYLMCAVQSDHGLHFCSCLSAMIMYLRNLFLLLECW